MLELIKGFKKSNEQGKELTYANLIKENEELKDESYRWMETSGYMEHLYNESKNDNELLKDENARLNDMCFQLTQENSLMDSYIKELQRDNLEAMEENLVLKVEIGNTKLENQMYSEKIEQLSDQLEIKERLDTDKPLDEDYYHTKELDYGLLSKTIDKITDERNTYKEVINIMCDKFDISHDSVLNIIDDISQNKSIEKERV